MADARIEKVMNGPAEKLYLAVNQLENYPEFVPSVSAIRVSRKDDLSARVTYTVNIMKEVIYTLDTTVQKIDKAGKPGYRIEWKLVESESFKKNSGGWEFYAIAPDKTQVAYWVDVEFSFPVPGFILKKIIAGSLPSNIEAFEKRARTR